MFFLDPCFGAALQTYLPKPKLNAPPGFLYKFNAQPTLQGDTLLGLLQSWVYWDLAKKDLFYLKLWSICCKHVKQMTKHTLLIDCEHWCFQANNITFSVFIVNAELQLRKRSILIGVWSMVCMVLCMLN